MTVAPTSPSAVRATRAHGRVARVAVWLSAACSVVNAILILPIVVYYAIGRGADVENGGLLWEIHFNLGFAGMVGLLVAFVLAIVALVRHERWALLWLPLLAFPAFVVFVGSVV